MPNGWARSSALRARVTTVNDGASAWLGAELPFPYEFVTHQRPVWVNDIKHVLFRPFHDWIASGNVRLGTIAYVLGEIESVPRPKVLYAVSMAPHPASLRDPRLLPGTLCLFPGYAGSQMVSADGTVSRLHHVTVRETAAGRIEAYYHGLTASDESLRRPRNILVDEDTAHHLHVLTAWFGNPDNFASAGTGRVPLPPVRLRGAIPRGIGPEPQILALHDSVRIPHEQSGVSSHFYSAFLLARELPTKATISELFRTLKDYETGTSAPGQGTSYTGPIELSAQSIDLQAAMPASDRRVGNPLYRYLLHVRGILPGRVGGKFAMAAFPSQIPTRADFMRLGPEGIARLRAQMEKRRNR